MKIHTTTPRGRIVKDSIRQRDLTARPGPNEGLCASVLAVYCGDRCEVSLGHYEVEITRAELELLLQHWAPVDDGKVTLTGRDIHDKPFAIRVTPIGPKAP